MSRRGRPPILNDVKKAEILAVLASGCPRQTAAHYVGCDLKSIYNTALRDPEFAEQLYKREAHPEIFHLMNVKNASHEPRYWRASAWYLERCRPDHYASRDLDLVTHDQLARFMDRFTEMLVEEIPVDRYRKQVMARMNQFLAEMPDNLERRYKEGKYSRANRRVFPKNSSPRPLAAPENPQNSLAAPEGKNQDPLKIAAPDAPNSAPASTTSSAPAIFVSSPPRPAPARAAAETATADDDVETRIAK
jgi:hypothetical protein